MTPLADAELSEALIDSALPEIYRFNAFRVLNLAVHASDRQINDRADEILGCLRLGIPIEGESYLDFVPPPGENEVRNAVQRLRNPERRMVDELFWFWPQESQEYENDEALNALKRRDYDLARSIWTKQANDCKGMLGIISAHNLAILAHAKALDMEFAHSMSELDASDLKRKQEIWQDAYKWWNCCLAKDGLLVSWLEKRINDLHYNNLKIESARKLRNTIPGALININILLAIRASERDEQQVDQNIQLIKNNNRIIDKFAERTLRNTVRLMADYVKRTSDSLVDEAKQNSFRGEQIALTLIDKTKTHLKLMDSLLPLKNAIREGAHDIVANDIIDTIILFAKETENWNVTLDLLKRALSIAEGNETKLRATKEIITVSNIIRSSMIPGEPTSPLTPIPSVITEISKIERINLHRKAGGIIGAVLGFALAVMMGYGWMAGLLVIIVGYVLGRWIAGKAA